MSGCPCCQLHVHSTSSFKDGLTPADELVARAAEIHAEKGTMPGIGLSDHGVLFGAPAFFKACKKHGLRGVIGMEGYEAVPHAFDMERDGEVFKIKWADLGVRDRYYHITLWVMNLEGWLNLVALHNRAWSAEFHPSVRGKPLLDRAGLERYSGGLILGLGCPAGRVNRALARGDEDGAYQQAKWAAEVFGDRCYMELMANLPEQQQLLRPQRKLAKRLGVQTLASNDVHYKLQSDGVENGPHHILVQSRAFKKAGTEAATDRADDGFGQWYGSDGFYLKDGDEMLATGGLERAEIERTVEVLERCGFDFYSLPAPKPPVAAVPAPGEDPTFDEWAAMLSGAERDEILARAGT